MTDNRRVEFIPANHEAAARFEEKLAGNILFQNTDNFMAIYNNNLVNKSNEEVDAIAKEIVEVYKNVVLSSRQFLVKTREEVVADEFEVLFPHIAFVATLKRIARDIINENYPEDTKFVFTESDANLVQIYDPLADEVVEYDGAERLRNANKAISTNPFINSENVHIEGFGEDGIAFRVTDILRLDTSFISDIGELLEAYVSEQQ